jgi:hypothetical protein
VTASAAHLGPSSAIAHNDPNRVAPKTSARPSRSRGSGKGLALRRRRPLRVEVVDLPEQRTGDGQLDRDDGLEVLNRYVHPTIIIASGGRSRRASKTPPQLVASFFSL